MWSPSAGMLRVGLAQQGLAIARLPRFGLGLGMGLSLARQAAVQYLPCAADPTPQTAPWRAAVDALAQWLAEQKKPRLQVQVLLAGRFARWQLLPWRAELGSAEELAAYAALCFRQTYGRVAQDWQVLPAALLPGSTAPAAAVDSALMAALEQACGSCGAQLQTVTPYFSAAFDAWRARLKGPALWFGTLEADMLSLGLLQGGQWQALQTQRVAGDWQAPLAALMAHMASACTVPDGAPLYLAGDLEAPFVMSGPPFTWLAPQPLATPTKPGLRLAMGC